MPQTLHCAPYCRGGHPQLQLPLHSQLWLSPRALTGISSNTCRWLEKACSETNVHGLTKLHDLTHINNSALPFNIWRKCLEIHIQGPCVRKSGRPCLQSLQQEESPYIAGSLRLVFLCRALLTDYATYTLAFRIGASCCHYCFGTNLPDHQFRIVRFADVAELE